MAVKVEKNEEEVKTNVDEFSENAKDDIFGETLGSAEKPKIDELSVEEKTKEPSQEDKVKSGELESEKSVPAVIKPSEEPKKEAMQEEKVKKPKETEELKGSEKSKDELGDQIKAAVEAALPKAELKAELKVEDYKDRYFNTQQYATQVNQENGTLRQNITTVEAQLTEAARQLKEVGLEITPSQRQPIQYQPPAQYQQPQIDPRLDASLTSAESKFTPTVVDEYLHPQNGKFHKMVAEGNATEIFQKVNTSLDPLVEAINLTKKWEQGRVKVVAQEAEDRTALIESIVAKVRKQIGIGGQPSNGGKIKLPTNLNSVRSDSNVATKAIKAETEEKETFGEHLG